MNRYVVVRHVGFTFWDPQAYHTARHVTTTWAVFDRLWNFKRVSDELWSKEKARALCAQFEAEHRERLAA